MKKYLIILLLPLLVITISCEDDISSSDDDSDTEIICRLINTTTSGMFNYVINYTWSGSTRSYSYSVTMSEGVASVSGYDTYDSNGNIIETSNTTNGVTSTSIYEYDSQDRLIRTTYSGSINYVINYTWSGSTRSYSYSYTTSGVTTSKSGYDTYDSNGNIIERSSTTDGTTYTYVYEYDSQYKLIKTTISGHFNYVIYYTWSGSTRSYSYSIISSGVGTYASGYEIYDSNGNIIERSSTINGATSTSINEYDCD